MWPTLSSAKLITVSSTTERASSAGCGLPSGPVVLTARVTCSLGV